MADPLPDQGRKRARRREKPVDFGYLKWAHLGVPMLISAGDDTKLFTYPVKEFTQFSPHDICPAPQRVSIQLAANTEFSQTSLLLVQASHSLDILRVRVKGGAFFDMARGPSGGLASTNGLFQIKSSRKIICSTISNTGVFFAYSDHVKISLFELKKCIRSEKKEVKKCKVGEGELTLNKRELPRKLPFAHSMVFSFDSSRLMIAGHDRRIYVSCLFFVAQFYYGFIVLLDPLMFYDAASLKQNFLGVLLWMPCFLLDQCYVSLACLAFILDLAITL